MLGIARHTDYAARIILHLACLEDGARVPIAEIAARRLLPAAFVRRVVVQLANAGLLHTVRGAGGGVQLGRPAAEISLLDLVRAMEGDVALNRCVATPQSCPLASTCPVQRAWTGATQRLEEYLDGVRFDVLANALETGVTKQGYPRAERVRATRATRRKA